MIGFGNTEITKAYLGSTEIDKMYLGDELVFNAEPDVIIMTSETNAEVMGICYTQGWAANADYMTKKEAEAVTNIGQVFRGNTNITTFHEFQYFTSLTSLPAYAFYGSSITEITLPNTITVLNARCFQYCKKLSSINTENVTTIGTLAFYNNTELVSVDLTNCTTCSEGCFANCTKLERVGSVSNLTSIDSGFYGLFQSTKISGTFIFDSFNGLNIPASLFSGCSLVNDAQFPASNYTSIGAFAFRNCGIQSFSIREGCVTLNDHSFSGTSWRFIDLPSTLSTWNGYAMWGNSNQKVVVCRASTPPSIAKTTGPQKSFDRIPSTCKVYVPQASISLYEAAAGWNVFSGRYLPIEGTWYETHRSLDPNE